MERLLAQALSGEGFFAFPGVLLLRGPDAFSFLQGQGTRDLRRLSGPSGVLFLNHKGQIEEAATLFPHPEGFLLAPYALRTGLTPYARFGDWAVGLALTIFLLGLILRVRPPGWRNR